MNNESIRKEIGIIKRNQMGLLKLKSTIIGVKHSLDKFNRKLERQKEDRGNGGN